MSVFYINVGMKHFIEPNWFLHIIPPILSPIGLELVYLSGYYEIVFGAMLIVPMFRKMGAYFLILLLLAVYPAKSMAMSISKDLASFTKLISDIE